MVESAIRLIVEDCRAAVVQNVLGHLNHFKHRPLFRGQFGNAFDLLCVEDGVHAMNESSAAAFVTLVGRLVSIALIGANWFRSRVACGVHLPELNLRSLLSLANLPRQTGCLPVRHPAWIPVPAEKARRHEVNRIATAVCFACRWIYRHVERSISGVPWLLPRGHALFQPVDNCICDPPPGIPSGRLT